MTQTAPSRELSHRGDQRDQRPDTQAVARGQEMQGMAEAVRMHGSASVTDLVMRARNDDKQAWEALVERYAPLVWSICRRYRLSGADAADVWQNVWLRLVEQLDRLRDPAALPGWLVTTTRRECCRIVRTA